MTPEHRESGASSSWGHTSVPEICDVARRGEPCSYCHARAGQPCTAARPGVHLCRICRAVADHLLTMLDEVSVMHDRDVYSGADLVLDEAVTHAS